MKMMSLITESTARPLLYFELCIGEGVEEDTNTDTWMCIRGVDTPTCEEALEFIKRGNPELKGHVKSVSAIESAAACSFYDFTHVASWPIFDRKDVSDLAAKTCEGCAWLTVTGNDVCPVCQRKTLERADIDYYGTCGFKRD